MGEVWGIRGKGFASFGSKKLTLSTFHKEILIMPAIKNQFNGTDFDTTRTTCLFSITISIHGVTDRNTIINKGSYVNTNIIE